MYRGLYDTRTGLAPRDFAVIGKMTARLVLPWHAWVHRRVERVTFCDEDALHRDTSIDFTLPKWFHDVRKGVRAIEYAEREEPPPSSTEAYRSLVPLQFLRKGTLVNFSLRDDRGRPLPLLSTIQNAQVSEAVLVEVAKAALDAKPLPAPIRAELRTLIHQPPAEAVGSLGLLFERTDDHIGVRRDLAGHAIFCPLATTLATNFLALTVMTIAEHERRIVKLSYEESLWDQLGGNAVRRAHRMATLALGGGRQLDIVVPNVGDGDSYHLEIEAPDELQVATRQRYVHPSLPTRTIAKSGGFKRAHLHFSNPPPGSEAMARVKLLPRRSTIVRGAFFATVLALLATSLIAARIEEILSASDGGRTAATILLSFTGLIGVVAARPTTSTMANDLLLPVRLMAVVPGALGMLAAAVIVGQFTLCTTRTLLIGSALLMFGAAIALFSHWRRIVHAARK